jgi:hypothetical protein
LSGPARTPGTIYPIKVIFDTCTLHDDLAMSGLDSRTVLGQASRGKFELVMPIVVFLETVNKMRERIETATGKIVNGALSLKKIGVGQGIVPPSHATLTAEFTSGLKDRIAAVGRFAPIPDADHGELVARSIRGIKPFRSSGVGYRDALIWLTVLAEAQDDDVVFVSSNSKDFAEDGELHPDLKSEVALCPHEVTLLGSMEEFIARYVPPADRALAKVEQLLTDPTFEAVMGREITGLLADDDKWPYHSSVTLVPGQPAGVLSGGPFMTQIDTVDLLDVAVSDAVEFDPEDGIAVLALTVKTEMMLDLLFDKGDAHQLLESGADISFYDFDYNETYAAGQTTVFVRGELRCLFDGEKIDQLELISLDDLAPDDTDHPAAAD